MILAAMCPPFFCICKILPGEPVDIDLHRIFEWEGRGYMLTRQPPSAYYYMVQGIFKNPI